MHFEPLGDYEDEAPRIQSYLNEAYGQSEQTIDILEAGCGRFWDFRELKFPYRLTGIDLDAEALRLRKDEARDLHVAIHGDLTRAEFAPGSFDVVYSSYVLEHVSGVEPLILNFCRWLRPGGVLCVRIPDGNSAFSTITRMTPHWFHVFYYRWILGYENAGRPGCLPYPTYFDPPVSLDGMERFAHLNGLEPVRRYRTAVQRMSGSRGLAVRAAVGAVRLLSLRHRTSAHHDPTLILRKPRVDDVYPLPDAELTGLAQLSPA